MELREVKEALSRIRNEFTEMPEMKLTMPQVSRLLCLPTAACEVALATLVDTGFLIRTENGSFVRTTSASVRRLSGSAPMARVF
jgi:hypothetical protein